MDNPTILSATKFTASANPPKPNELRIECREWLENNTTDKWKFVLVNSSHKLEPTISSSDKMINFEVVVIKIDYELHFADPTDAMHFKLRWDGA